MASPKAKKVFRRMTFDDPGCEHISFGNWVGVCGKKPTVASVSLDLDMPQDLAGHVEDLQKPWRVCAKHLREIEQQNLRTDKIVRDEDVV